MNYLLLLLSALSLAASQNLDRDGKLCPIHVVVNQIVLVHKTPVYVSAHICEETALVVGGTTIHVTNAPTFLETGFEIANTITITSTMTPPGGSNGQPLIPGAPSTGNAPVKPGIIPGGSPIGNEPGNEPVKPGSASTPTPNSDTPNPSEPSAGNNPSNGASTSSDKSSVTSSPSSSAASSGEISTSSSNMEPISTTGPSNLDSTTDSLNTGTTSPTGSSITGTTTIPVSSGIISTTGPSSTTSHPGSTPPPGNNTPTTVPPSSTTSLCIVTATPVPECCINELPTGCEPLETTNGPALEPIIPACESALEPYLTQDMKDCWAGNITDQSRGTYIADCLEYELELTCITELPSDCKELGDATGFAVPAGAAKCREALGPFVHGTSAPCLDEDNITDATQGKSIVDCLEVAFGFRSGPVTITDGEICPRTTSVV